MVTKKVNIDSIDKIQSFVHILNNFSGHFDLSSGCSKVNAKSLMGIFSLDISRPLDFNIYNDEYAEYILKAISAYLISSNQG
ncbi:MAG: HPr family phosphocarrier protein [Eubacterium sp.]|nr:HPr family phosphocarrier protein [Eubacterium sp.]